MKNNTPVRNILTSLMIFMIVAGLIANFAISWTNVQANTITANIAMEKVIQNEKSIAVIQNDLKYIKERLDEIMAKLNKQ